MANTLFELYKERGQKLPSIAERSKTFEELELGSADTYRGTFNQNVALLSSLQSQSAPAPSPAPPVSSPVARVGAVTAQPTALPTKSSLPTKTTISGQTVPTNVGLFQQFRADIDKRLGALDEKEQNILQAQRDLPSRTDLLSTARSDEPGLLDDVTRAQSLDDRLAGLEASIFESERDIRDRIKRSGGIVTESQTQRLAAAETRPLLEEFNRLSSERNRLTSRISSKEGRAREFADTKFEDLSRALGIASTELEFGRKRYDVYRDVASDLLKASQQDIEQIIEMAQSKDKATKEAAEDEISLALKLADLAVKTPAGSSFNIGGQTVTGIKPPSSSSGSVSTLSPTQFNIRSGLAGLTKDQANDVVALTTPPAWFKAQEEQKTQSSLAPTELQRRWDEIRNKVQTESETKSSSNDDPFQAIIDQALAGLATP